MKKEYIAPSIVALFFDELMATNEQSLDGVVGEDDDDSFTAKSASEFEEDETIFKQSQTNIWSDEE